MADYQVHALVVVRAEGNLRFRYTGSYTSCKESSCTVGITADSQGQILTADNIITLIHIIAFLLYVEINILYRPWSLCVNWRDDLFVTENITRKVKEIHYLSNCLINYSKVDSGPVHQAYPFSV